MAKRLFTSESVTEGHPGQNLRPNFRCGAGRISDNDPYARVACEVAVTTGLVLVIGEISTKADYVDIPSIVRNTIKEIGYTRAKYGFDADTCAVLTSLNEQSPDIAQGVNAAWKPAKARMCVEEIGQYRRRRPGADVRVCRERNAGTDAAADRAGAPAGAPVGGSAQERHPRLFASRRQDPGDDRIRRRQAGSRRHHRRIHPASGRCHAGANQKDIKEHVIKPVVPAELLDDGPKYFINPTGRFVIGGPQGDAGLTGRKIIVDTYGGYARHGGGAFSGKDPTKVDRSAAYAARYVAKEHRRGRPGRQVRNPVAYAIGVAQPVSINVDTYGTGKIGEEKLAQLVRENFDLRPAGIISMLDLRRPIYRQTAAYGHFGRDDLDVPWERTDKAGRLLRKSWRSGCNVVCSLWAEIMTTTCGILMRVP